MQPELDAPTTVTFSRGLSDPEHRLQGARQPAREAQRAIQRRHADAGRAWGRHRLVFHLGIEVGDVAGGEMAQCVVVGTAQDLGQLAALVAMHRHALAGADAQHQQGAAAGPDGADEVHAGSHPAPIQRAVRVAEIRMQRCREAGMDDHVGKPIQVAELLRVIAARLEQRAAEAAAA